MVGDAKMGFASPEIKRAGGNGVLLHVWVDEVDAFYARALEAGAESLQSPTDLFHGDREVILADPFGHIWIVLQQIEEVSIEETVRRANELLAAGVDT
nr:VOC family protein [Nonomuraea mesophila]